MAYGRHQSFYVKNNWINKGIKAIQSNPSIFSSIENYKNLGIGKNMFMALKYWLQALNIVDKNFDLTNFGVFILNNDLSCNYNLTLNLLHYYLVLNSPINEVEISDTFYFVFSEYDYKSFSKEELLDSLINYDHDKNKNTSIKTLSRDIDCLIQTYTKLDQTHPEDLNFSVLAKLHLFKKQKEFLTRVPLRFDLISKEAMYYVILRLRPDIKNRSLTVDELENEEMSWGRVFHLTRTDIINLIEEMISEGFPIVITRTNNLDTVLINDERSAEEYLDTIFERGLK
jgi:hypothetical protein